MDEHGFHGTKSAGCRERGDEVEIVKEVDGGVGVEVSAGVITAEGGNEVEVVEEVDGGVAVEVGGAGG